MESHEVVMFRKIKAVTIVSYNYYTNYRREN